MFRKTVPLLAGCLLTGFALTASAVTLNIGLDKVSAANLSPVPVNTLALLVVQNGSGGFTNPLAGASLALNSYLSGSTGNGNYIAWRGDFSGSQVAGVFSQNIIFNIGTADIPTNSNFALYWFPQLTTSTTTLPAGTSFGYYSSLDASQFGSQSAWNVGSNNAAVYAINAFTINNTGSLTPNPRPNGLADSALSATSVVAVPEPTTVGLFGAVACLALVLRRRLRSS